jgi:hypothetical protein
MDIKDANSEWQVALMRSKMASVEARLASQEVTQLFMAATAGRGPGPTAGQLEVVRHLEQAARDARTVEEAILNRVFGVSR